tara:strand:+ start:279 stop:827 length:549 start_codon:yes stop_codon:yes gene_type:complete
METLLKSSKKLYQDYKGKIIDVLLFGSLAKNKFKPNDIDIAIILKNTKEKELLNLMGKFSKYFNKKTHLNLLIIETILKNPLFKTLIDEGISLLDNKQLNQKLGYESGAIFSLNLTKLEKSKKVLFSYALHGKKDNEGILKKLNGKEIGRAVFFIPVKFTGEFKQFLEVWNVDVYMMKVLKG